MVAGGGREEGGVGDHGVVAAGVVAEDGLGGSGGESRGRGG